MLLAINSPYTASQAFFKGKTDCLLGARIFLNNCISAIYEYKKTLQNLPLTTKNLQIQPTYAY